MIIILAVDDKEGMLFNNRRQSQDRELRKRILEITNNKSLWMNQYSAKQFSTEDAPNLKINDDFLIKAGAGEYCFVENDSVLPYLNKIEKIVLFKWNRRYPSDFYLAIDLADGNWVLESTNEFQGSSHEKITEEIYNHENN